MIDSNPIQRRLIMLGIFARHFGEQLIGQGYPRAADDIDALLTIYEKQVLYRLAGNLTENSKIVEIGSFKGGSTYCFAAATQQSDVQIHCIDTFNTENVDGAEGTDTFPIFQRNLKPFLEHIYIHRGFSHDVINEINFPIDLLFVDGDHSYEGVTQDLRLYLPLMRQNSVLIMHDSAYDPVKQAIQEQVIPVELKRLARLPNMYAGRVNGKNT